VALAAGVAALHVLVGYALTSGMATVLIPSTVEPEALTVIELTPPVAPEPPPEPPPPPKQPEAERQGGGPVAPRPPSPAPKIENIPIPALPAPRPVILQVPPIATAGAVEAGEGEAGGGTGGEGTGSGSGVGTGEGFTDARQTKGRFRNSDFPPSARSAGRVRIGVRYAVVPSGHVEQCEVIESSGWPEVDAMTCRVITERYRFRPARDGQGVAITKVMEEDYTWTLD